MNPAPLTVTASSASITYGDTPPAITPTYSGFVNGDSAASLSTQPSCNTAATSSSPAGTYTSGCSGAVDPNYAISYSSGTIGVAPALLSVIALSTSIGYGSASPNVTASYSGFVGGDSATSLTTQPACSSNVLPTSPVGDYPSTCSGAVDPNYAISYVAGDVSVSPVALQVTASSATMTYGSATPTVTPIVVGLQNNEPASALGVGLTCTTATSSSSPAGSYATSCSGASDANYTISYVEGTLAVTPATLTVTASSAPLTYGGTTPTVTPQVSGLVNGDTVAVLGNGLTCFSSATATSPVGTYASSCQGASDSNYTIGYATGTIQVVAAPLTVAASSASMSYGSSVPTITPNFSGFVNGEGPGVLNSPPMCSTTATSTSPVGTYASTCSGGSDPDYSLSYVPGQVVVGTAALVISASSGTKSYGDAAPTITPTYSGFLNGDTAHSLTTQPTCSTTATATSSVGSYDTTCGGASDPNYSITYTSGSVHVVPAPLSVTASSASVTYGSKSPAITPTATGFVDGEHIGVLGAGLACSTVTGPSSPVGSYVSTCSGGSDPNYTISYSSGTVAVTPAPLTVTATNLTKQFGAAVPALTVTDSGFVNGQTLATSGVTGQPLCSTTAGTMSPIGTYPITCQPGTLASANYSFAFVAGTLTVTYTTTLSCLTSGSVTVSAGQSVRVAPGCLVLGSITVNSGGSLDSEGATILGTLIAKGGAVRLCSTNLALILAATGSTAPIVVGDGTSACAGSVLIGGVNLSSNTGGVSLQRAGAVGVIGVTKRIRAV